MTTEDQTTVNLAIGRILRLASRPTQPGDIADYERCRRLILDRLPLLEPDFRVNWVRDRLEGAQGD